MATIGTATIKIKPVLDDATLTAIKDQLAAAVEEGVRRGMARAQQKKPRPEASRVAGPFVETHLP